MKPWLAWRFMLRGTERGRFSPLTSFAWVAIGLGTAAMTGLISVMYGFESTLKARVLSAQPHVVVRATSRSSISSPEKYTSALSQLPLVSRVTPFVEAEMIVVLGSRSLGAVVWGIPRGEFLRLRGLKEGTMPDYEASEAQALVAVELAERLGANPGSDLEVASPLVSPALGVPITSHFRVSGIYASGHYEFDQQHLFVFLEDAQDLLRMGDEVHGWQIRASDVDHASRVAEEARRLLGMEFEVQTWEELNSALFQSLKLEQMAMLSILSLAVVIAVLNVAITLAMHVTYKRRNIGILRALGASEKTIHGIFFWQGAWIGLVGLGIGLVLTLGFFVYVQHFSAYQLPDIYYDRSLPIQLRAIPTVVIFSVTAILVLFSTIVPARAAARLDPLEAIRE